MRTSEVAKVINNTRYSKACGIWRGSLMACILPPVSVTSSDVDVEIASDIATSFFSAVAFGRPLEKILL